MELKELKLKTEKELKQILNEFRDKLRELRFKDANKQLKDVREIREIKKTVARVLTLIRVSKSNNIIKEKNF
jgi:large subunit ribosomal protein L29